MIRLYNYNNFLIKYVCIEPCVIELKNQFIFEHKIPFDFSLLNTAKIKVLFKKVFNKFKFDFIVMHYFINKNYI